MSTDVANRPNACGAKPGSPVSFAGILPSLPVAASPVFPAFRHAGATTQPFLDAKPLGFDANPGIAGTLTFARSTPTWPVSVGGPRFFRPDHARVEDSCRRRPGMNGFQQCFVYQSAVRTCSRVLPP